MTSHALFVRVAAMACERVWDKNSLVRRSALNCLEQAISQNPFSPVLDPEIFPESANGGNKEEEEEESDEDLKKREFKANCLSFIQTVKDAMEKIATTLIFSHTLSDIVCSLPIISLGVRFSVPGSGEVLKRALGVVWSQEDAVRKASLSMFLSVVIHGRREEEEGGDDETGIEEAFATNLSSLIARCSHEDLEAISQFLHLMNNKELVSSLDVNFSAIDMIEVRERCWMLVTDNMSTHKWMIACGALLAISILPSEEGGEFDKVAKIFSRGGDFSFQDQLPESIEGKYSILSSLAFFLQAGDLNYQEELACSIIEFLVSHHPPQGYEVLWMQTAENGIRCLPNISSSPQTLALSLLKQLSHSASQDQSRSNSNLHALLFCIGEVSLLSAHVSEIQFDAFQKREKESRESEEENQALGDNNKEEEEDLGYELMVVAEEEREFSELMEGGLVEGETSLLSSFENLLIQTITSQEVPLLMRETAVLSFCKYISISSITTERHLRFLFTLFTDESIPHPIKHSIAVAVGDLCTRFPNSVEPFTPILYSSLQLKTNSEKEDETSNNIMEVGVRKNTLKVLTHLILSDMIKVKGGVGEVVMCLEDEDPEISQIARLFFQELSKRSSNPIYNLLPDIISTLSRALSRSALSSEGFKRILSFLLSFIQKEKQVETILEKMAHRLAQSTFRGVDEEGETGEANSEETVREMRRCLAFSMDQLPPPNHTKSLKKLIDIVPQFKEALLDKEIFQNLRNIGEKISKKVTGKENEEEVVAEYFSLLKEVRGELEEEEDFSTEKSPNNCENEFDSDKNPKTEFEEEDQNENRIVLGEINN